VPSAPGHWSSPREAPTLDPLPSLCNEGALRAFAVAYDTGFIRAQITAGESAADAENTCSIDGGDDTVPIADS
jgi:hypothetical protein